MLEWVSWCARFGDVVIEVKDGAQTMDGVGRERRGGPVWGLVCWGVVLIEDFWGREGIVRWAGRRLVRNSSRMG